MVRAVFLGGLASVGLAPSTPAPSPEATTSADAASASAPDCKKNPVLPYDKRLEIVDSVLDGPDFRLSAYRGYAVWINIFATWCGPCRAEQPLVVETAAKYHDRGLRTFGLFADETDDAVRSYRKKYEIAYPLIRDQNGILTHNLQGSAKNTVFPAHLFITGEGRLFCYQIGGLDEDSMAYTVGQLLQTVALPTPEATEQR